MGKEVRSQETLVLVCNPKRHHSPIIILFWHAEHCGYPYVSGTMASRRYTSGSLSTLIKHVNNVNGL